ncbi:MAG TPA: tetratricopeptide repeat protein, partial [Geminicoccaceae bacterium]|nr:tetratricopeptide repeat protein [Geminicoccaceae bacterium]
AADPDMPLAQCTKGYFFKLFGMRALDPRAEAALASARAALAARGGGTGRERLHVAALEAWCRGDRVAATDAWERILARYPLDVLAIRLAHFTYFYMGESRRLRESIDRVLPAWGEDVPGYGYVLGCHAFGLEESGEYGLAERAGRRAVGLNPMDVWATHAVAHVMEMQGRSRDGIAWLTAHEADWGGVNSFANHVFWHRALFHLELGERDAVLDLYDRRVRAEESTENLDLCNAASLLWRLEEEGIGVGDRWRELGERAARRVGDSALTFVDEHLMMALAAAGREAEAATLLASMRDHAAADATPEGEATRRVGLPLAEAILALRRGEPGRALERLLPIRCEVRRVGGSHAQRDVFGRMLVEAALRAGRFDVARGVLADRLVARPASRWGWERYARALAGAGDAAGATGAEARAARLRAAV